MLVVDDNPVMRVIMEDDPRLKEISEPVTEFDADLITLVETMGNTLDVYNGLGLSAVQVGVTKRIILARDGRDVLVMVNPVITRTLAREAVMREGCLSVPPEKWRDVSRPAKCDVTWQDPVGGVHHKGFNGLTARIIQHEIDHLNGILITDK